MPMGEGFWLHKTGKHYAIYEHYQAIRESPQSYGMTAATVAYQAGEDETKARDRVLRAVMAKGWIRVRSHHGYTVFEYHKLDRRVADAIFEFMVDVLGAGIGSAFSMNEVSTGRTFNVTAASFYEDVEERLAGARAGRPTNRGGERLFMLAYTFGQGR